MYYLFADSGSTKTNWILTDTYYSVLDNFQTIGLNPYFVTYNNVLQHIKDNFPKHYDSLKVSEVFFYGSGCEAQDSFSHLQQALKDLFANSKINIYSDMLGTARAVLKNNTGIAAIIGTGTNSCLYNGENIIQNAISLGYILGDEGSGAYIGKQLLKLYLEKKLDEKLSEKILNETGATHTSILNAVYSNPHPNRFLASFCPFIKDHIEHPELQNIINDSFKKFFQYYIEIYPNFNNYQLGFCGSIAINFKDFIHNIARSYKIYNIVYINNTLPELMTYHKLCNNN